MIDMVKIYEVLCPECGERVIKSYKGLHDYKDDGTNRKGLHHSDLKKHHCKEVD